MPKRTYLLRLAVLFVLFFGGFAALAQHLYTIQILRHEELLAKARETYMAQAKTRGQRGAIVDARGNRLVGNLACKDILAEPRRMPADQRAYIRRVLAERLRVKPEVLRERFASDRVEVVVARRVPVQQARAVQELELPGLRFVDRQRRYYPKGRLLSNVLGFTNGNNVGVYGLEQVWDDVLLPRHSTTRYERDRRGRRLVRQLPEPGRELDGQTLWLTVDEVLQAIVEAELRKLVREHRPKSAYAVMARPGSGEIVAIAQWPSFNPNDRSEMDPGRWRNRMLSDVYPPGSTMKPIAIAGALDHGVVTLESEVDCEGGWWYYAGRPLRDAGHSYDMLSVAEVIQKSSNIGTAKIAMRLGRQRLYQVLRRFGFGARTGVGLRPESPGLLRRPPDWDGLSITRFPIGQGVSVTPLQMVQAYCALANGGRLPQLHIVKGIGSEEEMSPLPTQRRHMAVRPAAATAIVDALCMVTTTEGTARRARIEGYEVAGKTGTSQKLVDGSYEGHEKYIASFIGFVPARDPAFVLLVVADEPSGDSYYGGTVCAPTFREISKRALRYLNVSPAPDGALVDNR